MNNLLYPACGFVLVYCGSIRLRLFIKTLRRPQLLHLYHFSGACRVFWGLAVSSQNPLLQVTLVWGNSSLIFTLRCCEADRDKRRTTAMPQFI
ncbi:hypothetical protein RRG08_011859 [Elysia crispata]|uniref:Uncharacterized protein n=1 Tax=Elysia crispata TaxID=231223 RepID=A0AAE1DIL0_9GAST|nr:hypothetical protein RRG08_011859 [Elysia crispata]